MVLRRFIAKGSSGTKINGSGRETDGPTMHNDRRFFITFSTNYKEVSL